MQEDSARSIFKEIVAGVRYCHRRNVVHRDLKPDNILFVCKPGANPGTVKIADFGLSSTVTSLGRSRSPVGTPLFSAPEIIAPQSFGSGKVSADTSRTLPNLTVIPLQAYNASRADCWSLGVILFRMIFGQLPFSAKTLSALQALQQSGCPQFPTTNTVSAQCLALIASLLSVGPDERLTAEEILHHTWFSHINSRLEKAPDKMQSVFQVPRQAALIHHRNLDYTKSVGQVHLNTSKQLKAPLMMSRSCDGLEAEAVSAHASSDQADTPTHASLHNEARRRSMSLSTAVDLTPESDVSPPQRPRTANRFLPQLTIGITSPRLGGLGASSEDVSNWVGLSATSQGHTAEAPSSADPPASDTAERNARDFTTATGWPLFKTSSALNVESPTRQRSRSCVVTPTVTSRPSVATPGSPASTKALTTGKRVVRRRRSRARSTASSPITASSVFF